LTEKGHKKKFKKIIFLADGEETQEKHTQKILKHPQELWGKKNSSKDFQTHKLSC
jgi:hypothetical protein